MASLYFVFCVVSNDAHFEIAVYVNKENCRIKENPRKIHEKLLYTTLWCSVVIGPCFFL